MNDAPLKVVITGALGRMGQALVRRVQEADDAELYGATERQDHPDIGRDIGGLLLGRNVGVTVEADLRNVIVAANAIVDFTMPEASVLHAAVAADYGIPLVVGTTGLDAEQRAKIADAADRVPIVMAPNMSVGVNLLFHLARRAAAAIGLDTDIEIVETHHRNKVDAPSGTAVRLAEIVGEELGYDDPEPYIEHGRLGAVGPREYGRIGMHAVRGGDIVGRHDLYFYGAGEVVTLSHLATTRENFVAGAIRAAHWVREREPGLYDMADVLGFK